MLRQSDTNKSTCICFTQHASMHAHKHTHTQRSHTGTTFETMWGMTKSKSAWKEWHTKFWGLGPCPCCPHFCSRADCQTTIPTYSTQGSQGLLFLMDLIKYFDFYCVNHMRCWFGNICKPVASSIRHTKRYWIKQIVLPSSFHPD